MRIACQSFFHLTTRIVIYLQGLYIKKDFYALAIYGFESQSGLR
jgi:hypothetical protein